MDDLFESAISSKMQTPDTAVWEPVIKPKKFKSKLNQKKDHLQNWIAYSKEIREEPADFDQKATSKKKLQNHADKKLAEDTLSQMAVEGKSTANFPDEMSDFSERASDSEPVDSDDDFNQRDDAATRQLMKEQEAFLAQHQN